MVEVEPRNVLAVVARAVSTFTILRFAARQELVTLRHLPLLVLTGSILAHTPYTLLYLRSPPKDGPITKFPGWTAVLLGIVKGLRTTLFLWSLLKIPPGPAVALCLLAEPISQIVVMSKQSTQGAPLRTWLSTAFLLLIAARAVPMNPHSFFFAGLSVLLSITLNAFNTQYLPPSAIQNPLYNLVLNASALIPAALLAGMMSARVFGENLKHPYNLKAEKLYSVIAFVASTFSCHYLANTPKVSDAFTSIKTLGLTLATVFALFVPIVGARLKLYDVVLLAAVAALAWPDAFPKGSEETFGMLSSEAERSRVLIKSFLL